MSFGASFLDATADTSATPNQVIAEYDLESGGHLTPCSGTSTPSSRHGATTPGSSSGCHLVAAVKENRTSRRQQIVLELFQTEKNYVGILHTILKVFKEEIERPDQPGGPILDPPNVKIIFGEVPPIYNAHIKMRDELNELMNNWREDCLVGDVFLRHADALIKCYPPFVNYFTNTKETIRDCDRNLPRFHAFLKVCQTKQECGRQSLTELLIRPVQRLPSVMLILKEMLKRTEEKNPDYRQLEKAISALEEVMTHINEDKRKTECHQTMFDIINDIENCPPNLLSSHRTFVTRVDVVELTDELSGRGDPLSLFVFSDSLELCKRRVKVLNSSKTPTPHSAKTPQKAFKHIEVMQLSSIKRVVDIVNTTADADCKNVFALVTKKMNEEERRYAFALVDEGVKKIDFLTTLSKTICNSTCRADYACILVKWTKETLLTTVDSQTLSIDTSDVGSRLLSKAANRFSKRVSRAFSFNKTPRKLKRAMSSMTQLVSPRGRDVSSVSINPYLLNTPGSEFKAMRLATELSGAVSYSDLVDQMNIGTPVPLRRRETLTDADSPISAILRTPLSVRHMTINGPPLPTSALQFDNPT
ncbi:Protein ECT2 [Lamellibrachia satsuma]|nr:Protein ECT2 [Lamellibrachia satsuma]